MAIRPRAMYLTLIYRRAGTSFCEKTHPEALEGRELSVTVFSAPVRAGGLPI
jgi:hypothetical protein